MYKRQPFISTRIIAKIKNNDQSNKNGKLALSYNINKAKKIKENNGNDILIHRKNTIIDAN